MKIRPVGAELLRTERRTDMSKLKVASFNFAKGPKNKIFQQTEILAICGPGKDVRTEQNRLRQPLRH